MVPCSLRGPKNLPALNAALDSSLITNFSINDIARFKADLEAKIRYFILKKPINFMLFIAELLFMFCF